ncbi:hypothetical protein KJ980_07815 [Patescibacteria group bacterium]|nr:hypothetical protein [Patescibacteria group bacterium]MBU4099526.1 hypothetical protein [Patescibacteria group bacterium]
MTDDQLLENIRSIVNEEIKTGTDPLKKELLTLKKEQQSLIDQVDLLNAKQQYFEQIQRSLMQGQRSLEQNTADIQQQLKSLTKQHGKKLDFIAKTVEIIGRVYDERIVENWREIQKIYHYALNLRNLVYTSVAFKKQDYIVFNN